MPLLLLTFACEYRPLGDSNTVEDTETEPTVTIADPTLENLTVTNCAAPSTLNLTFTTPNPTVATVEFGPTSAYGYSSVPSPTAKTAHHLEVPGFPGGEEWHWRVLVDGEDGPYATADQTFTGGALPPGEIPSFTLGARVDGAYTPGFRIAPGLSETNFLTIVNDDGASIWWTTFESPNAATQAHMAADGSGIIYMLGDYTRETDIGMIVAQDWCGESVVETRAEWGHHDFVVKPDGTYAYLKADIRDVDGTSIVGDAVVEIQPDGTGETSVWSTWDNLILTVPPDCEPEFYPQGCDWTHGNNVYYQPEEDAYFYSSHQISCVARFERNGGGEGQGLTTWVAGSQEENSTIDFDNEETRWDRQHGFKAVGDDEYILFDNGPGGAGEPSELRRVRIDPAAGEITTVWNSEYDGEHQSLLLGDIQLMPNGNYYAGWGSEAEITEMTPEEELVWQVSFDLGVALAFTNEVMNIGGEVP